MSSSHKNGRGSDLGRGGAADDAGLLVDKGYEGCEGCKGCDGCDNSTGWYSLGSKFAGRLTTTWTELLRPPLDCSSS